MDAITVVKWTGRSMQFVGNLLTAEAFEEWLKAEGHALIEKEVGKGILKALPRRSRRIQKFKEAEAGLNSGPFRHALENRLAKLPTLVASLGEEIYRKGPKELSEKEVIGQAWIAIVPRSLVRSKYNEYLMAELSNSAELERLQAFPSIYLRGVSKGSEDAFFKLIDKEKQYICPKGIIPRLDHQVDWGLDRDVGHYYYASGGFLSDDLNNRSSRNTFLKDIEPLMGRLVDRLGTMGNEQKDKIADQLRTTQWSFRG